LVALAVAAALCIGSIAIGQPIGHPIGLGTADETALEATTRHDRLRSELAERLDSLTEELALPGVSLAVVMEGQTLLIGGAGVADVERGTPMDERTVVRIGPVAETMASVVAARLVDMGRARWDTSLIRGLPVVRLRSGAQTRSTTLIDLLGHRSGLALDDRLWSHATRRGEIVGALADARPVEIPAVRPCAAGTFAALTLLGVLDGSDADRVLRRRLLDPIGVTAIASRASDVDPDAERHAVGHRRRDLDRAVAVVVDESHASAMAPIRGQWSTAESLLPYLELLAEMGRVGDERIISRERMSQLLGIHDAVGSDDLTGQQMSAGWVVEQWRGQLRAGRSGVEGFQSAAIAVVPERRVAVAAFTPIDDVVALDHFVRVVLDLLVGNDPTESGHAPILDGQYRIGVDGQRASIKTVGGQTTLTLGRDRRIPLLKPDEKGRQAGVAGDMVMVAAAEGAAEGVLLEGEGQFALLRRHGLPTILVPANADLAAIADAAAVVGIGSLINVYRDAATEQRLAIGLGGGGTPTLIAGAQGALPLAPVSVVLESAWPTRWRVVGVSSLGIDVERAVDGSLIALRLVAPNAEVRLTPQWPIFDADPRAAAARLLSKAAVPDAPQNPIRLAGILRMPSQALRARVEIIHLSDGVRASLASSAFDVISIESELEVGVRPRQRTQLEPTALGEFVAELLTDATLALRPEFSIDRTATAYLLGPADDDSARVLTTLSGVAGADDLRVVLHLDPETGVTRAIELPDADGMVMRLVRREVVDGVDVVVEVDFEHSTLGVANLILTAE